MRVLKVPSRVGPARYDCDPVTKVETMRILAAIAVVITVGLVGIHPASAAPDPRDGTVLIFGDSTTSQSTDDVGDPQRGWWSTLAESRNLYPVTSAQAGGGIIKKGIGCSGTAIRERSASVIARVKPDEIWIAAGRNDTKVCVNGVIRLISPTFRGKAAKAYFAQLAAIVDTAGIDRRNVYITTIWGTKDLVKRHDVVVALRDGAIAAGLKYVNLPRLSTAYTRDGTHPNTAGHAYIASYLGGRMSPHFKPDVAAEPPAETVVQ